MHAKIVIFMLLAVLANTISAQENEPILPGENDYYKIIKVPVPEGIVLEVGGLVALPDGSVAVSTRRGDVWVVENAYSKTPYYRLFASGLHEILGLAYQDGALYCAQRGELTKLSDRDGDGVADRYETVYAWPVSGHYHEYSFGPKIMPDGSFMVSGNVSFGNSDWWAGKSGVPWRGWLMNIKPDGSMTPWAAGMRSPCGIGAADGSFYYGDNQGDWMGSGFISVVEKGDFMGHPASLAWADRPESPVKMRKEIVFSAIDPRDNPQVKPEYVFEEGEISFYEFAKRNPGLGIKTPAVWLPHGVLGVSTSEIVKDNTAGGFGPFAGQLFVGDQGMSKIARVYIEKVDGVVQGAAFDFRSGFESGVLRMDFGLDNNMFVGGTNRGWGSTGEEPFSFERLVWTGQMPFEIQNVQAKPDGFELHFTSAADKASAENPDNYTVSSYCYKYHPVYGSPVIQRKTNQVLGVKASADGKSVRIVVDSLREGFIHDIRPAGVVSAADKYPLLHGEAYYTLNKIPAGAKADFALRQPKQEQKRIALTNNPGEIVGTPDNQMKEARPGGPVKEPVKAKTEPKKPVADAKAKPVFNESEIQALLNKHTCSACHKKAERSVGPAFTEIAKRKYSTQKMVKLVQNPQPQNWPDYTPMAPMSHVPKQDIEKIAVWINSLKK